MRCDIFWQNVRYDRDLDTGQHVAFLAGKIDADAAHVLASRLRLDEDIEAVITPSAVGLGGMLGGAVIRLISDEPLDGRLDEIRAAFVDATD